LEVNPADFEEMRQAASLCMHVVDAKEWDRLNEVFTEGAVYDGRQTAIATMVEGVGEIAKLWSGLRMGVHSSTDFVVTSYHSGEGTAESVSKWSSKQADGKFNTGRYVDVWNRTAAGWRVAHRINILTYPDSQ
jgi:ketosteroid isomerase-like protein